MLSQNCSNLCIDTDFKKNPTLKGHNTAAPFMVIPTYTGVG